MIVGIAYNVKHNLDYEHSDQTDLEFDSIDVIERIEAAIHSLGHETIRIEADENAFITLKENKDKLNLVFNLAEGLWGDARESQIPLFCEILKIPYTHSNPTTQAIKLNKSLSKIIVANLGVKVPKSFVVTNAENFEKEANGKFPYLVKPNNQGSSKGIFNDSLVNNKDELKKAVDRVLEKFDTSVLVEEYIDGREFTVSLLGPNPFVLPIIEQKFDLLPEGYNKIAGYELKWIFENVENSDLDKVYGCPAAITPDLKKLIEETSIKIWEALNIYDACRIDYRYKNGELYFLEVNTLPGMNSDPKSLSIFVLSAQRAGYNYAQVIEAIIESARSRWKI